MAIYFCHETWFFVSYIHVVSGSFSLSFFYIGGDLGGNVSQAMVSQHVRTKNDWSD
jgi:hypothetical protein